MKPAPATQPNCLLRARRPPWLCDLATSERSVISERVPAGVPCQTRPMLDERLVTALHVEALRRGELAAEHEAHVLFQASTIAALLQGAYDGDVTFSELAEHGDLGLGPLNGLDGDVIALDGRFYRADLDGGIHPVPATARTPFAVVVWFQPSVEFEVEFAAGGGGPGEGLKTPPPPRAASWGVPGERGFRVV